MDGTSAASLDSRLQSTRSTVKFGVVIEGTDNGPRADRVFSYRGNNKL